MSISLLLLLQPRDWVGESDHPTALPPHVRLRVVRQALLHRPGRLSLPLLLPLGHRPHLRPHPDRGEQPQGPEVSGQWFSRVERWRECIRTKQEMDHVNSEMTIRRCTLSLQICRHSARTLIPGQPPGPHAQQQAREPLPPHPLLRLLCLHPHPLLGLVRLPEVRHGGERGQQRGEFFFSQLKFVTNFSAEFDSL